MHFFTLVSVLSVLLMVLAQDDANAYVRSKTASGAEFYWEQSCAPITVYLNGFEKRNGGIMTESGIIKSVVSAAHAWSTDAVSCQSGDVPTSPYFEIVPTVAPPSTTPPQAAYDGKNSIIFRTDMWSKSGQPGMAYAFGALAVTTVTALGDGQIVDADMEINAVDVVWMNLDPGVTVPFPQVASLVFDLQNALTHEFGHFIGLGHTCFDSSMGSSELWPIDDKGNKVPDCNEPDLPIDIKNTVMFPVTNAGDVNKRVLSPDDINAVCQIYAPSIAHEECRLDSVAPACAISPAGPCHPGRDLRSATAAALVCILAIVTRRRRCPSARRQPSTPSSASI